MNTPPGLDGQMSEALRNMAAHRAASHALDRRGWTNKQWADDAKQLMSDLDGSVSSLLNGHVTGLIAERDAAVARAEAAEQAVQRVRAVLARWEYTPGRMAHVDVIRRALDGTP